MTLFWAAYPVCLGILLSVILSASADAQQYNLHTNAQGKYVVERNPDQAASNLPVFRTTTGVFLTVTKDEKKPATNAFAEVTFAAGFPPKTVSFFYLSFKSSAQPTAPVTSVMFGRKAIDETTGAVRLPIGGLRENTTYDFELMVFDGCAGNPEAKCTYTTGSSTGQPGKVLLVIDKEWENDDAIKEALHIYEQDIAGADASLRFQEYYLSDDKAELGILYEHIRTLFADPHIPLKYLFFIGKNANAPFVSEKLDSRTSQVSQTFAGSGVGMYAQLTAPEYHFDPARRVFLKKQYDPCDSRYQDGTDDIFMPILQSYVFDISYGSLVPPRVEESKTYILKYFEKLHRFKSGEITFEKRALIADSQFYDRDVPDKVEALTGRWRHNDTLDVPQKFGPGYHGADPIWQADFINKLNHRSYEVMTYVGHGSPNLHYFGMDYKEVNSLNNLNTLLLDFTACSVGDVQTRDYLAGVYLAKGNTLITSAYSTVMLLAVSGNKSPLAELKFEEGRALRLLSQGMRVSDAYRFGCDLDLVRYLLGDPLLTLDSPCREKADLTLTVEGAKELCPSDTAMLIASPVFSDFRWRKDGKLIDNYDLAYLRVTQAGIYTVSAKRCGSEYVNDKPVTISRKTDKPAPTLELLTLPDHFLLNVLPAKTYAGFHWYLDGIPLKEGDEDTLRPQVPGDYSVEVFDSGCKLSPPSVSVRIPAPVLGIEGRNPACTGDSIEVIAPEGYTSYQWFFNDERPVFSSANKRMFTTGGRVAAVAMRGNFASPVSALINLVFSPRPDKPAITVTVDGLLSSSRENNQWYLNGTLLNGAKEPVLKNLNAGAYVVRVDKDGCYADSDPTVITATEPSIGLSTVFYPNPGEGKFTAASANFLNQAKVDVFNANGQKVPHLTYHGMFSGTMLIEINASDGLYLIRLQSGGSIQTHRVLIRKN